MFELLAGVLASATFVIGGTCIVDLIIKAPSYKGPESDHFNGKTFRNLDGIKARGLKDILKWALTEDPGPWDKILKGDAVVGSLPGSTLADGSLNVTFVNHATFLIQMDGMNILTDPIWSKRASPFQWIGPKRMRPPGIKFEELPEIHTVLISHNHYDHLDINTVKKLDQKFSPLFITPLGVSKYLQKNGITNTVELDWWEKNSIAKDLSVSAVPAQHFSGRGLSDRDKTLWCGYVVETDYANIYFAGDTGYDGFFKEIGRQFDPIEVALIPIGAYRPRWFMEPIHVDPEQAVQIHKDVRAKTSIGMHFGTFPLADDGMDEPVRDLAKARNKFGLKDEEFVTIAEGTSFCWSPAKSRLEQASSF